LVEVLLCIAEVMEPAASCPPKDTCYRWYPALVGAATSVAVATVFFVVEVAAAAEVLALRAHALLDGDLL
jgi:hypothetical protein